MLIPIIMAVWLGFRARRMGRNWARWALVGFFLPLLVHTLVVNLLVFALAEQLAEPGNEPYLLTIIAIGAVTGIVTTIVAGLKGLKPQESHRFEAVSRPGSFDEPESSPWTADTTREESPAETADHRRVRY